ncbi:Uncharacterised protein [Vibrio cholerae]|nr:Uncharacterised protein [Vibrio cholerae]
MTGDFDGANLVRSAVIWTHRVSTFLWLYQFGWGRIIAQSPYRR